MNARRTPSEAAIGSRVIRSSRPVRSRSRQAGMTTLGIMIVASFVGLFAYGGIRLTPVYLNYMKVSGVLNGVQEEFDGQNPSRESIRKSISRRFDVESVSEISAKDINVTAEGNGFKVQVSYDHTTPFVGNVHFTVKFNKSVQVRR